MKKKVSKWKKNRIERLSTKKTNTKKKFFAILIVIILCMFFIFNKATILNSVIFTKISNTYQNKNQEFYKIKKYPNVKIRFSEFNK